MHPRKHGRASIAQLGERGTEVAKVTGSIPVGGTFFVVSLLFFTKK